MNKINDIAQAIYDKKGKNIIAIDVRGISSVTDFFLIAEGSVERHVKSLGKAVVDQLRKEGDVSQHVDGDQEGDWVVVDAGSIIVHLLTPAFREKYSLEELWHEGKIVDLELKLEL